VADEVTRAQLLQAKADIQRQIETLQAPSRSYNQVLNADMIARLRGALAEINTLLAESPHA